MVCVTIGGVDSATQEIETLQEELAEALAVLAAQNTVSTAILQDISEATALTNNNLTLLNKRTEEAYETHLDEEDLEHDN